MKPEPHSRESISAISNLGFTWRYLAATLILITTATLALSAMGRIWWCKCGGSFIWSSDIVSTHNSQHLLDPYSFTHVLHGIALYSIVWLLLGSKTTPATRALIVVAIESAWEVFENTSFVIERYRETTISLDYYGDSILNSLSDIGACIGGLVVAMTAPVWVSAALFVVVEVALLLWVRDSLVLNIVMLVFPLDAIKDWQTGAVGARFQHQLAWCSGRLRISWTLASMIL